MGNTILAKGVNHILAKRDNSAWPKGAKLSGFSSGVYRAETHAAGEGGKEERAVHDGENAGGDWRGSLLQDTALEPDTQIKAWAGGCACFYAPPLRERTVLSIHGPPQFHNDIME